MTFLFSASTVETTTMEITVVPGGGKLTVPRSMVAVETVPTVLLPPLLLGCMKTKWTKRYTLSSFPPSLLLLRLLLLPPPRLPTPWVLVMLLKLQLLLLLPLPLSTLLLNLRWAPLRVWAGAAAVVGHRPEATTTAASVAAAFAAAVDIEENKSSRTRSKSRSRNRLVLHM